MEIYTITINLTAISLAVYWKHIYPNQGCWISSSQITWNFGFLLHSEICCSQINSSIFFFPLFFFIDNNKINLSKNFCAELCTELFTNNSNLLLCTSRKEVGQCCLVKVKIYHIGNCRFIYYCDYIRLGFNCTAN